MKKLVLALSAVALSLTGISAASAATTIQGGPYTNLNPAGDKVHFGFAAFPTGKGFYFYEAVKPAAGARPTVFNPNQVWVSESQGATSPKGDIAVSVAATFSTADCTKDACGIFVRLDHTAPTDMSEDQFFPISFAAGTGAPVLAPDTISASIKGTALSTKAPGTLAYRTPVTVDVMTGSGATATIVSSTPDCSVKGNVIEALKVTAAGCDFAITSPGNAMAATKTSHFPFMIVKADQNFAAIAASLKIGKSITLPSQSNFGEALTYKVASKNCSLKGGKLTGLKSGACAVAVSAVGNDNYNALASNVVVKVSK